MECFTRIFTTTEQCNDDGYITLKFLTDTKLWGKNSTHFFVLKSASIWIISPTKFDGILHSLDGAQAAMH